MPQLGEMKRYECGDNRCDCGRVLEIHRSTAGFHVTLIDPGFEADDVLNEGELVQQMADAVADGEFWVYGGEGNEGSIALTDAQIADLRAWALGEVQP